MEFLHSINTQWKIPLGRPPRTFQIPGTPYPTKSYFNLKIWNLKFLIQNNSFVIHLKYSLSLTIFSHCQHCLRGQLDTACRLVWTQLWNFIVRQVEFNAFLHPNEHPERICLYLVRQFEAEPAKIGDFQISKSIYEAKYDLIFLKPKFLSKYQIRRTTFIKRIYLFNHSCQNFI